MFLGIGALFLVCGGLLAAKARKMPRGLAPVVGLCALGMALLGLRALCYAFFSV